MATTAAVAPIQIHGRLPVLPADETPGAKAAGCVNFIDKALAHEDADALPLYRAALAELERVCRARWKKTFAELEAATQDKEYGLACVEAVSGNYENALPLLEKALIEGQVDKGWARIDPEFAFMTDHPRFIALVET